MFYGTIVFILIALWKTLLDTPILKLWGQRYDTIRKARNKTAWQSLNCDEVMFRASGQMRPINIAYSKYHDIIYS